MSKVFFEVLDAEFHPYYFDPERVTSMFWRNGMSITSKDYDTLVIVMEGGREYWLVKEDGEKFIETCTTVPVRYWSEPEYYAIWGDSADAMRK